MFKLIFALLMAIISAGLFIKMKKSNTKFINFLINFAVYSMFYIFIDSAFHFFPDSYGELHYMYILFIAFACVITPIIVYYFDKNISIKILPDDESSNDTVSDDKENKKKKKKKIGRENLFSSKNVFLSLSLFAVLFTQWLNTLFSVFKNDEYQFQLEIPIVFNLYFLISFIVSCIVPIVFANCLLIWCQINFKSVYHKILFTIFKKEISINVSVFKMIELSYIYLSITLSAVLILRSFFTVYNADFKFNERINMIFINSKNLFNHEHMIFISVIVALLLLLVNTVINPKFRIIKKEKKRGK